MALVRCFQLAFALRSISLDQEGNWDTCNFVLRRLGMVSSFPDFLHTGKRMFFPIEWWQK